MNKLSLIKYVVSMTLLAAVVLGITYSVEYVINNYRQQSCEAAGGVFMRSIDAERSYCVSKGA